MKRMVDIFGCAVSVKDEDFQPIEEKTGLDLQGIFDEAINVYALAVWRKCQGGVIAAFDDKERTYQAIHLPGLDGVEPGPMPSPDPPEIKEEKDLAPVLLKTGLDLFDAFNEALVMYTWAVEKESEGKVFGATDKEEKFYKGFIFPGLQNARLKI